MQKKAVTLVSGGADSSTVLAIAHKEGYEIHALSFDYGQNNVVELEKIKSLVKQYRVKSHKIIKIDLTLFDTSALTAKTIDVPKYKQASDVGDDVPITYVPARNTIFLSYALGYAEVVGARDLFIGVHQSDSANYPDCRPEYIASYEKMANLATNMGSEVGGIKINTPLINMAKTEIIKTGLDLGVDYSNTISCYDPDENGLSCASCLACLIRLDAFKKNDAIDPIEYQNK